MTISLIVAAAENDVIGRDGRLPWKLSTDLRRFKRLTSGHPVLMGRRTWESIGRPLPKRTNLVWTRDRALAPAGCLVVHSWEEALAQAALRDPDGELFVIGGAEVYRHAMPFADTIQLTRVEAEIEGDVVFPSVDPKIWDRTHSESHPSGPKDEYPFRFETWSRKRDDRAR